MRLVLIILLGIHGIIHLFGFLKAFEIFQFNAITQPISRTFGLVWLFTFILFVFTILLLIFKSEYWWLIGFSAVVVSQILIFNYWSDAKFGTIANLIILVSVMIAYSSFSYKNKILKERIFMLENSKNITKDVITEETISGLPYIVQQWLINNGTIGKSPISNVHLVQKLELKLKPEQSEWNNGTAEQYITVQPPSFNWSISTQMNSIFDVVGRDKFQNGQGEMIIKLFSLFPVAEAKNHEHINQATLQRYLAEIVWYPSAALSSYIKWDSLSEYSAKATMEYNGTKGSGEFHFDEKGDFKKFVAMRYQDTNSVMPTEWTVVATKTEERNGIKIPVNCEASWKLESGNWTWLKLKIKDIEYNVKKF